VVVVIILQHHLRKVILVEVALRLEVLVVEVVQEPQVQILQVTLLLVLVVLVLYSHKFHHHMEQQVHLLVDGLPVVVEEEQVEQPQVLVDLVVEVMVQLILLDPTQQQTLEEVVVDRVNLVLTEVVTGVVLVVLVSLLLDIKSKYLKKSYGTTSFSRKYTLRI
jgi:hypothetical protein